MSTSIVIGGGIVGLCSALALQRRGYKVEIYSEEPRLGAASWGNAGHIAVEQIEPLASMSLIKSLPKRLFLRGGPAAFPISAIRQWLPFGLRLLRASAGFHEGTKALSYLCTEALPAWRSLITDISEPRLLIEEGHLIIWENQANYARGLPALLESQRDHVQTADLDTKTLRRIDRLVEPSLVGGARFTGSASVRDLGALKTALLRTFHGRGGVVQQRTLSRLPDREDTLIVVAAGFGSAALMRAAGYRSPLIAERGYHIQAKRTDWPDDLPPVVFEDRSIIATKFEAGLRIAGFVEFSDHLSRPDPCKWERLRKHVSELGIRFDGVSEWMGIRPTFPDYLPAIGRSTTHPNLIYAFGHQHLGLTLGPLTGELVADLADRQIENEALTPFSLDRFGRKHG